MKQILFTIALAFAAQAFAGEDSTDHWGPGGTGPAWYQTKCGLAGFTGPSDDYRRPCSNTSREELEVFTPGRASSKERDVGARGSTRRESKQDARGEGARADRSAD